jgi:ATP-dependent RNA helicase DeaD
MRAFKNETLSVPVATDLAARGIDVSDLAFVAHYQLPESDEYYTHRIGRTARAGKEGVSMCFVNANEVKVLKHYERSLGIKFEQVKKNYWLDPSKKPISFFPPCLRLDGMQVMNSLG